MKTYALFYTEKISPCAVLVDSKRVEYPIYREIDEVLKEEYYRLDYINGYRDVYAESLPELLRLLKTEYECKIVEIK